MLVWVDETVADLLYFAEAASYQSQASSNPKKAKSRLSRTPGPLCRREDLEDGLLSLSADQILTLLRVGLMMIWSIRGAARRHVLARYASKSLATNDELTSKPSDSKLHHCIHSLIVIFTSYKVSIHISHRTFRPRSIVTFHE